MKLKALTIGLSALALSACADLGFGVDVGSGGVDPYFYGGGPVYSGPWGGLGWSYDFPLYSPSRPFPPPFIGGPGPAYPPSYRPSVRPPSNPPANGNGQVNGVPTINLGGNQRPGNGGLPSPSQMQHSTLKVDPARSETLNQFINNNARRGR